jgi:hypothetical protein
MKPGVLVGAALAVFGALIIPGSAAGQAPDAAITAAVAFIAGAQQPDGGFGGFGDGQTFDAVFALRAAGIDPATVTNGGKTPADFLAARAGAQDSAAEAAKAALAAVALGLDPEDAGGIDLIAVVEGEYDAATGLYGADAFSQGLTMIGLACTGNGVPAAAVAALREMQLDDGGWGFDGASDPDTSAVALQALLAAGAPLTDGDVAAAVAYFKAGQASDGGWGFSATESNASSTAYAIQALIAAGEPIGTAAYEQGGVTPIEYLLSQQLPDGSFAGFDPGFAANQVVPALAGRTLCNAPATPITRTLPTATPTATATATSTPAPQTPPVGPGTPQAPRPPATGSGLGAHEGHLPVALVAITVVVLAAGAWLGVAMRRR